MVDIKKYDFFAKGKSDFYNRFSHNSILCQGKHWKTPPLVTILIPTYKRPELLRQALESALNQKEFGDYQIIIVDNEGKPIEEETLTAKVVKEYQDERVIYYRHDRELSIYKMDAAVRLARSPWIVFLHDDDILAENHLKIMTDIVKRHKEIKFLGCKEKEFTTKQDIEKENAYTYHYIIQKMLKNATCFRNWTGWLGALISRKHYIAIGGMPAIKMGCGDKAMVGVFLHHYGTYSCQTDGPLYYYRLGEQQISYTQRDTWERVLINEYCFERYVINKYHKFTHKLWERNLAYLTLQKCEAYNSGIYHTQISLDNVISECDMPSDIKERKLLYYFTTGIFWIYIKCIKHLCYWYMQRLKRSDIYLDIE